MPRDQMANPSSDGEPLHVKLMRGIVASYDGPRQTYRPRPQPASCTIYFIGPEGGPIKIGHAVNFKLRFRDLELANALPLRVLATVEGSPAIERAYHKQFAACRLHGEWFERTPELLAEIERLTTRPALADKEMGEKLC